MAMSPDSLDPYAREPRFQAAAAHLFDVAFLGGEGGVKLLWDRGGRVFQVGKPVRADGEKVAAGQLSDLADVAERGAHDLRVVAVLFVVVEDGADGSNARIRVVCVEARLLLVPVEDTPDEGGDEPHVHLGARDGLAETEEERQVAVDAFLFENLGGLDAFPRGTQLDQDALLRDASSFVQLNELVSFLDGAFDIE